MERDRTSTTSSKVAPSLNNVPASSTLFASILFRDISIPGLISSILGPCGRLLNKILLQFGTDPAAARHWHADRIATAERGCLSACVAQGDCLQRTVSDSFPFFQPFCMPSNKMIAVASTDTTHTYLVLTNSNINVPVLPDV